MLVESLHWQVHVAVVMALDGHWQTLFESNVKGVGQDASHLSTPVSDWT